MLFPKNVLDELLDENSIEGLQEDKISRFLGVSGNGVLNIDSL